MGIKDLWTILGPYSERKPLYELQNKRVAIDLSGWVCQAQCITDYSIQPKMYLRNLYFRTCFLLLQDVWPVFVLEGSAPSLKYKTIANRNEIQFKGAKPRSPSAKKTDPSKGRTRFDSTLKQCEQMLNLLGLTCLTGTGEAEAMCAYLNQNGLVEGCISQDSDCFAYGARIVYRNFSISAQGANNACIDVYDLEKAIKDIDFGRNKTIALAVLSGSDYNEGVHGVGKDSVMKFFQTIDDESVLQRLREWKSSKFDALEKTIANLCSQCGHHGKKTVHVRKGCLSCKTVKGQCVISEEHLNKRNEMSIRSKALLCDQFPDEDLIGEFLKCKETIDQIELEWKMPDLHKFMQFTMKYLQWEEIYSFSKLFPILTRWIILHGSDKNIKIPTEPLEIKKVRNPKGVQSYEIIWDNAKIQNLIPKEQLETVDVIKLFSTIEPQTPFDKNYPHLVETFKKSKEKPKKLPKTLKKPSKTTKKRQNKELSEKIPKKNPKTQTLQAKISKKTHEDSLNHSLNDSLFDTSDQELDLSAIIDEVTSQELPQLVQDKLQAIRNVQNRQKIVEKPLEGSFYGFYGKEIGEKEDIFERLHTTLILNDDSDSSSDSSDHEEETEDTFLVEEYVPLIERIKRRNLLLNS